jgi:integrase
MARGNIRPRTCKDGSISYQVRAELPPDPVSGKRRSRAGSFRTEKEAERALTKWLSEVDEGTVILPSKITMRDLCRRWLADEAAHRVRPTTLAGYTLTVEKHVIPCLGNVPAQRLSAADILKWRTELLRDTSPRTTQLALQRLRQILDWAVSVELLPKNSAAKVRPPKWTPAERTIWTAAEARAFLAAAENDTLGTLWRVALLTGLRRGELLALRWQDIDLDAGRLTVKQSLVMCGGKAVIQPPKSKAALRSVKLSSDTVAALLAEKDRQVWARKRAGTRWADTGLVFTTGIGTALSPRNVGRSFEAMLARADVPKVRLHDLRHVSASLDLASGTSVKAVAARLGHSDPSITLRTYAHVLPHEETAAAERLGALLSTNEGWETL